MKPDNFLIDTSIWVDLFKGSEPARRTVLPLVQQGRAWICGVVVYELLVGVKYPAQRSEMLATLDALNYVEMEQADWLNAALTFHELREKGVVIPFSDLLLAALAQAHRCAILTRDAHFSYIKEVRAVDLDGIRT